MLQDTVSVIRRCPAGAKNDTVFIWIGITPESVSECILRTAAGWDRQRSVADRGIEIGDVGSSVGPPQTQGQGS